MLSSESDNNQQWGKQVLHQEYMPHIDGIRAFAILPVFLYHLSAHLCPAGFAGVDVFFVISGYLICKGILANLKKGDFTISNFYLRRIRRILPAYFLMVLLAFITGTLLLYAGPMKLLGEATLMSSLFLENIFSAKLFSGYFTVFSEQNPLGNLWSLSVEEQFYLFIPLLMLWIGWKRIFLLKTMIWALLILSFLGATYLIYNQKTTEAFYYLPWRSWELLSGALLSFVPKLKNTCSFHKYLSFLGFGLIFLQYFLFDQHSFFPGAGALPCIIGTLILIRYGHISAGSKILSLRPLVFIGKISYSLYLYHWPVIIFWKYFQYADFINDYQLTFFDYAGICVLSFLLSYISWKYVETPLRIYNWTRKKAFVFALTGIVVISSLGLLASLTKGFKNYIHKEANISASKGHYESFFEPRTQIIKELFNDSGQYLNMTKVGNKNAEASFVLIGDSHAEHFGEGMNMLSSTYPVSGYIYIIKRRQLNDALMGNPNPNFDRIVEMIKTNNKIKFVAISCYSKGILDQIIKIDSILQFCRQMKNYAKKVYLLDDIPCWDSPELAKWSFFNGPSDFYAKTKLIPFKHEHEQPWIMERHIFDRYYEPVSRQYGMVAKQGLAERIPMNLSLLEGDYYISIDPDSKEAYYIDSNHVFGKGSLRAVLFFYSHVFPHLKIDGKK